MVGRKKVGFIHAQSSYRVTDGCVLVLFLVCISGIYYCKQLLGASNSFIFDFQAWGYDQPRLTEYREA